MEYRPYGQPERLIASEGGPDLEGAAPPYGDLRAENGAAPTGITAHAPAREAQGDAPTPPTFAQLIGAASPAGAEAEREAALPATQALELWQREPAYSPLPPSADAASGMSAELPNQAAGALMPAAEAVPAGAYALERVPMSPIPWAGYGYAPPSREVDAPRTGFAPDAARVNAAPGSASYDSGMQAGFIQDPAQAGRADAGDAGYGEAMRPGFAPDATRPGCASDGIQPGCAQDARPQGYDIQGYDIQGYVSDAQGYAQDGRVYPPDGSVYPFDGQQGCAFDGQGYAGDEQGYASEGQSCMPETQGFPPDAQGYSSSEGPKPFRQSSFEGVPYGAFHAFDASPPPFGDASVFDTPPGYDAPYDAPSPFLDARSSYAKKHASFDPASIPMESFGTREGYSEFWQPEDRQGYWQQPEWQPSDWVQNAAQPYWTPEPLPVEGRKSRSFWRKRAQAAPGVPQARAETGLSRLTRKHFGTPKAAANTVMNLAYYALVIFILVSALRFALDDDPMKMLLGVRPYTVLTNSMRSSGPESISSGDVILVRDIDPAQVQVGDIITYQPGSDKSVYLTHRVTQKLDRYKGVEGDWFITKGDANNTEDLPVRGSTIVGKKLLVIPKLGHAMKYIYDNIALVGLMGAAALGLFIVLRIYFSARRPAA